MRKQTNRSRFSMAIAAAMGILGMSLATPALAAVSPVAVVSTSVSGGVVNVTVRNNSMLPETTTVAVQAVVNDTAVWSFAPANRAFVACFQVIHASRPSTNGALK